MPDIQGAVEAVGHALDLAGVAAILAGVFIATVSAARALTRRTDADTVFGSYRRNLGRAILLGLELLVAADIIRTVAIEPSLENVAVLGLIVLVRTFLSFSLEVELEGRWPWQRRDGQVREERSPRLGPPSASG